MPALSLFGTQYHMASDMMPILGLFLFLPSFGLLVTFTVLISILHSSPQPVCPTGERIIRESVIWGFLSLVALNSVAAAAMIVVGLQGTPFELSKRRAMQPLLYAQSVKWVASFGFTIYCFWAVYDIRHSCWSPALLRLLKGSLWAALAIYTLLFVVFFTGLNLLASYDPDKRWQIRLKKLSRVLGCQSTLTQVVDSENEAETPLQELAGWFGRFFGHIDLEKSDVVVGLALAQIMQVQQRKALIAQQLRQHGVVDPSAPDSSGPAAASTNGGVVATTAEQKPGAAGAAGGAAADSSAVSSQGDPESQLDSEFQRWLLGVAEGSRECLTPSHWGAKFAPELTPKQAAEVYTGCRDYVSLQALVEVQRVAKYAIAAYCVPRRGKPLRRLKKVLAGAKEPVRQQLQGGKARAKQYAAIQQITGCSDDDLIHMSFQNSTLGLCPYQILLNRPSKTVILAVRGSNSMEDLLTDMIDRPVDITAWLPSALREAHPECAQGVSAHMGMYCAAKAVLQDLSKRQILPILLTGAPLDSEQREREHQRHAPDDQQQRYKQERQGGRHSLDTNLGRWQGQRRQVQLQRARWSRQPSGRDSARAFNRWASSARGSEAGEEVFQTAQSMPAIISMARGQPSFTRNSSWLRESAGQRAADQAAAKSGAAAAAGHAGNESSSSKSGKSTAAAAGEVQLEPADYQRVLAERGVDCRGWKLVVTGHSLGAAVAALVGMQLRDWYPGVHVYAFSPPGGMITANLAHVLASCVTSVVVGKDSISRIGTVTFEGLIDSMVVALARTKLCKVRALLGLRSQALRERPMADLFHTTDAIPAEALAMLKGYWESKRQYADAFVPMCPPGRVLLLRRLKEDDEAYRQRDKQREKQQRCGSGSSTGGGGSGRHWGRRRPPIVAPPKLPLRCCSGCSGGTLLMWDAVWLQPERLVAEGILLGSTQASDHFTSTLSFVLDQLTGHETLRHQPPPDGPDTATATATAAAVATAAVTGVGEPTVAPAPQAEA